MPVCVIHILLDTVPARGLLNVVFVG